MKRYRISLYGICFDTMFVFNKCSEVLGTSDISWGLHNGEKGNSDISKWRTQAAGHFESEEFKTTREEIMLYGG